MQTGVGLVVVGVGSDEHKILRGSKLLEIERYPSETTCRLLHYFLLNLSFNRIPLSEIASLGAAVQH